MNTTIKLSALQASLLPSIGLLSTAGCKHRSNLPANAGSGATPLLPQPKKTLIATFIHCLR